MRSLHFLYHELRPARSRYSYVIPSSEFEAHCELFAHMRQRCDAERLIPEITFDDGNCSDLRLALPVLGRFGLSATFFITAGWTGKRAGFMDWSELRELHRAGQRIGAHGLTHTLLTSCNGAVLKQELTGSRKLLEDGLGAPVRTMSLPGGRANRRVFEACYAAGYEQVFTSLPQPEQMDGSPRTVGRLNLHAGTTVPWLETVLDPRTGALGRLTRVHRAKAAAQRVLGDRMYAALWGLVNRQESGTPETEIPAA